MKDGRKIGRCGVAMQYLIGIVVVLALGALMVVLVEAYLGKA
jgi:hypothetical protein